MSSASDRPRTEDKRRRAAADTVAVVRSLEVVEAHEALERAVQRAAAGEEGAA
jgi:hypothetical protein